MAGELGFEPRLCESESQVLPLHHSPSLDSAKFIISKGSCLVKQKTPVSYDGRAILAGIPMGENTRIYPEMYMPLPKADNGTRENVHA